VSRLLSEGHSVTIFGRDAGKIRAIFGGNAQAIPWDFLQSGEFSQQIGEQDAVIHLAGEPAAGRRLSDALRRKIRDSRVKTTRRLVDAMGQAPTKPKVFICASAIGFYGVMPGAETLDESAPGGSDFLAEVCHEWESAAQKADLFGVRVVLARMGVVLGGNGGMLAKLKPLFQLGLGGQISNGKQPMSWVALDDVVNALMFCMNSEAVRGPVNVVSPNPVNNETFTRELAESVQRMALFRVPALALRLAYGDGADIVLGGQRVRPSVLLREGFEFRYPELKLALAAAMAHT
jgi:uncharacterized protein (TIGR01777 family)